LFYINKRKINANSLKEKVQMPMSLQTAENRMKEIKALLIMLPTAMVLVSMIVFIIIAICSNPIIPIRMMHQFISLASQTPLSVAVWLFLSALIGGLALTRRKLGLKFSSTEI
jgi:ABC-type multidrug transport system permease subunit